MEPLFLLKYIVAFLSFIVLLYSLSLLCYLGINIKTFKNKNLITIILLLVGLLAISQVEKITNVLYINLANVLAMGIVLHMLTIISLILIYFYVKKSKDTIEKMLFIEPVKEDIKLSEKRDYDLDSGKMYVVAEKHPKKAYNMFLDQIRSGKKGVCITIEPKESIRETYGLKRTPIIEISADFTRYMRIEQIQHKLVEFILKTKGEGIILIDCIERLVTNTTFSEVYHMLEVLRDYVSKNDSILILSLNKDTLEKKEVALIEREAEIIKDD
ncbi:MAG: DUF835 domain-containing protein [Candidatus Aenigmarchaeota archaeon]|nr:DUF835 domain-containing protein [Candidatus Aenigmarchaeota archaeon]